MSVVHVQAQELLRKWRKAAGSACAGAALTPEKNGHLAELCWRVPRGLQRVWKQFDDPLDAVRAAISQTPWARVGESDGPMPLFSTETEEQLRAQLAERDARIGELEEQRRSLLASMSFVHRGEGLPKRVTAELIENLEKQAIAEKVAYIEMRTERDAALAKFRGLRGRLETAIGEYDGDNQAAAMLRAFCQRLLDRFPDEPSEKGEG